MLVSLRPNPELSFLWHEFRNAQLSNQDLAFTLDLWATLQADADREDILLLQHPPHRMRMIFDGLLPDWDSAKYAETHHLPTRAAQELYRYQLWPQVTTCGYRV